MLVIFKSRAAGDVIMLDDVAQRMFEIIGKPVSKQGVITVEQLPDAIARLTKAIADDKAARAQQARQEKDSEDKQRAESRAAAVSLTQRAVPLLEMFERSLKKSKPVTWGT